METREWKPRDRCSCEGEETTVVAGPDVAGQYVVDAGGEYCLIHGTELHPLPSPAPDRCGCVEDPWVWDGDGWHKRQAGLAICVSDTLPLDPVACSGCHYALLDGHAEAPAPALEPLDEAAVLSWTLTEHWGTAVSPAYIAALVSRFGVAAAPPPAEVREKAVEALRLRHKERWGYDHSGPEELHDMVAALTSAGLLAGGAPVDREKLVEVLERQPITGLHWDGGCRLSRLSAEAGQGGEGDE